MAPTGSQLDSLTCNVIKTCLDLGLSLTDTAKRTGVVRQTVATLRTNYEVFGTPYPPPAMGRGRPRALTAAQEDWVEAYFEEHPSAYMDEACLAIWDHFGVDIVPSTVWRLLQRRNWSRKKARVFAAARNDTVRAWWRAECMDWPINKLCFLDESASNERTGDRKFGWSHVGLQCVKLQSLQRGERWSILPALIVHGYLPGTFIIQGAVTKEMFEWWLLNWVIPQLEPGFKIVMDNASIYRGLCQEVLDALVEGDIAVHMLPPYSPDYNPIENTFNTLKAWIRRNGERMAFFLPGNFRGFLELAISEAVGSDCTEYFHYCYYGV